VDTAKSLQVSVLADAVRQSEADTARLKDGNTSEWTCHKRGNNNTFAGGKEKGWSLADGFSAIESCRTE
jgi:hypothetical protein